MVSCAAEKDAGRMPPWVLPLGAIAAMLAVLALCLYAQRPPGLVLLDAASGRWRTVDRRFIQRARQDGVPLAVATLVLNEARYLREWIQFHRLMGVGLFVIFDDNSTDATTTVVRDLVASGIVHLVHARASFRECAERRHLARHYQYACQKTVFNFALSQLRGTVAWMGNFDVDEFLWTPEGAPPLLVQLATTYATYDQLSIRSMVFGTSNHSQPIPANQTVIEAFTRRAPLPDGEGAPYYGARFGHKTLYRPGRMWLVDVHDARCSGACRVAHIEPLAANLRMNHYQFKSRAEEHAKAVANGNPYIEFDAPRDALLNEVRDRSITYLARELRLSMGLPAGT